VQFLISIASFYRRTKEEKPNLNKINRKIRNLRLKEKRY